MCKHTYSATCHKLEQYLAASHPSEDEESDVEGLLQYPPHHACIMDHKDITDTIACPRCWTEPEDAYHALVTCPKVWPIWVSSPLNLRSSWIFNFEEWWNGLCTDHTPNIVEKAVALCWAIWNYRNAVVWKKHNNLDSQLVGTEAS